LGNGGTGKHQACGCQDQERVRDFVEHRYANPSKESSSPVSC
jgi:hypothetical protein